MLALVLLVVPRLRPVDEAKRDPSFVSFRAQLAKAIRTRNVDYLMDHVAPDVRVSFGDDGGKADFVRQWRPSAKSKVWAELAPVVRLGGAWQGKTFWAPYVYAKWPEKYDPFTYLAVVEPNEKLRKGPGGPPIASAGYALVKPAPIRDNRGKDWLRVSLVGGPAGYIRAAALRRSIDYRAAFEKRKGTWMITAFVAGD